MTNQSTSNHSNIPFNTHDSWAIWETPKESLLDKSDQERQDLFRDNYQPDTFPIELLPKDLKPQLSEVKYVLLGLNPGNAGVSTENAQMYLNFHGKKKSLDYRLAAAVYGTELWGAFMTDLVHVNESNSDKVAVCQKDIERLEQHLDALNIPNDAILVAMGGKAQKALKGYKKRIVEPIPHYAGTNTRWKADKVRQIVEDIVARHV